MKLFKVSNSLDHPIAIGACDQRKKNNGDKIKNLKIKNKKMMGAVHFVWKFIKK